MRLSWEPRLQYSFAAAVGLVGAGVSAYVGIKQRQKAAEINKDNPYPQEAVPQAIQDNQQYARQAANEGLPSQIYANSMKDIQRNQQTAIRLASGRPGGVNGLIGSIQGNTNDAMDRLTARNAMAQQQNLRTLYGVNNTAGKYQQDAFNWNSKNRYNQQYNYSQSLEGAGNANLVHGIDSGVSQIPGLAKGAAGLFGNSGSRDPSGGQADYYGSDPLNA